MKLIHPGYVCPTGPEKPFNYKCPEPVALLLDAQDAEEVCGILEAADGKEGHMLGLLRKEIGQARGREKVKMWGDVALQTYLRLAEAAADELTDRNCDWVEIPPSMVALARGLLAGIERVTTEPALWAISTEQLYDTGQQEPTTQSILV